jgi:hypothetical protein
MAFLILIVFACVPLLSAFAYTIGAGLALASSSIGTINSRFTRFAAAVGVLVAVVVVAIAWPSTLLILARLPDFRTVGDGGVGMAYNFICKMATMLMTPASTCFLAGLLLHSIGHKQSQTDKA